MWNIKNKQATQTKENTDTENKLVVTRREEGWGKVKWVKRVNYITEMKLLVMSMLLLEKAMAPHSSTLAWKLPWTQGCLRRGVRASGPSQERTGESGAFGRVVWMWFGAFPGAFGLGRAQPQRRGSSP